MSKIVNSAILAVGHSHLNGFRRAYNNLYNKDPSARPFKLTFMRLLDDIFKPNIVSENGADRLNETIPEQFKAIVHQDNPDVIVSCLMGNEHTFISLLNHPRRFDFYLPSRPDLPTDESAQILPRALVEDVLSNRLEKFRLYLSVLAPLSNGRMIHVPPPPPIADARHIEKYPSLFEKRLLRLGVSPAPFRLKMWLLACEIQRRLCEDAGVLFYRPPDAAFDSSGFLAQACWSEDPTHGNAVYGKLLLDDISTTRFPALAMAE
jgi:hypothetical protein